MTLARLARPGLFLLPVVVLVVPLLTACTDPTPGVDGGPPASDLPVTTDLTAPADVPVATDLPAPVDLWPADVTADVPTPTDGGPADVTDLGSPDAPPVTELTVTVGGTRRLLDRAQLGLDRDPAGEVSGLHVEAHAGGDPACPEQDSPTPDCTLIIGNIPPVPDGTVLTEADGVSVTLLDFSCGLLPGPAPERFTTLSLTVVRSVLEPPGEVLLEATLEASSASGGTVSGTLVALHCTSLDGG
jgi:hypothetical protein